MHVFVTGGTGYIGSAVVRHLLQGGHTVTGLVRSPERQAQLARLGARGVLGDIRTPASYAAVAGEHEALVHLGFEYSAEATSADRTAVETLLAAARSGRGARSFVYTSGCLVLGPAGATPAYEDGPTAQAIFNTWRPAHEQVVLAASTPALAIAVIRPGWVYGGDGGQVAGYFETALKDGASAYIGDGKNRMPLVHREDVATLYRLVLERRATGIFHAVDGATGRVVEHAAAASRAAGKDGATRSIPLDEARKTIGPFAEATVVDQVLGSRRAQALGWKPRPAFVDTAAEAFADWQSARSGR
jgi:nucleoside-diphosphate-sugar epimerase